MVRLTIFQKLFLFFAAFTLLITVVGVSAFYQAMRLVLVENIRAELNATATEKEAALLDWFAARTREVAHLANAADVRQALLYLTSSSANLAPIGRTRLMEKFEERILSSGEHATLLMLDYDTGAVLFAGGDFADFTYKVDWTHQAAFFNGRLGVFAQTPYRFEGTDVPVVMISAPVSLPDASRQAGVLVVLYQVHTLDDVLARRSALRQTDDSYLVNSAYQYVTRPRLDDGQILVLESTDTSTSVTRCLAGQSGFDYSTDYRGVPTFKSYLWVPSYGLCLVAKVDADEVLQPINALIPDIVWSGVFFFVIGLTALSGLARAITRPVLALTDGAERLAAGYRDVHLDIKTGDELSRLADAFNSMAVSLAAQERQLRDYAAQLENMVATRTAELRASEALGHAVMENSPVGITVRNRAGDLIYWNSAWLSIYGVTEADLKDLQSQLETSSWARLVLRSELDKDVNYVQDEDGLLFIPEMPIEIPRLKITRWVSEYFYAIPNAQGKVDRVVTLVEDITERKQRQQEIENLLAFSAAVRMAESRQELEAIVLQQLCQHIGVENAGIVLRTPANFEVINGIGCGVWSNWRNQINQSASVGILGEVLRSRQMYTTDNVYNDPRRYGDNLGDVQALSMAPLIVNDLALGAMVIGAKAPFSDSQLRLFRAMADLVSNAFYRLSLSELTERRLQWLTAIRSIDQAIMSSMDLRITFNILLDRTLSQLSLDAAAILLLRQNSRLEYAAWRGLSAVNLASMSVRLGDLQAGRAALDQHTIIIPDYNTAEGWTSEVMTREQFRGYCAVPLITKGQVKGVLEVFSKSPLSVDMEWIEFLESLAGLAAISIENATLVETIQRTNTELSVAYDSTLLGWAQTVELRERYKQGRTRRMADQTLDLARMLGVEERDLPHIYRGVLLHDIGMLSIPETILLKAGRLTVQERALIEKHPEYANQIIKSIEYLRPALDIPYAHHEKWDGSGYPRGLKGENIPLPARLFAVIDVWDALTHHRPYRNAFSETDALAYLREQSGRHFDPKVVEAFLRLLGK